MKRSTRTALILVGCTLVLPLLAFEQGQQTGPPLNQQYPGADGLANFRKVVSGEFTGDVSRDAVFMDLNNPTMKVSPEFFDTWIGTGSPANDIAVLSGAIPGKDLLVAVEADGLKLYERNGFTAWNVTTVRDASSPWANAWRVAVGDVNGDGCPDIVGVAANKRDLLYLYGNCGTTFTTGPTVVNPTQVIYQLLLINWTNTNDTPGTVEAAIFSNLGWAVREDNGVWRKSVSWTASPSYGVVMKGSGAGPDRMITTAVFQGTDRLSICDEIRTEGPYNLGALGIVGMATGDMTSPTPDGDVDLILTTNTSKDALLYENQSPSQTTFNFATPAHFPYGPSNRNPALNQSGPEGITVGDFDGDGFLDAAVPAQGDANPGPLGVYGSTALIRPNTNYVLYRCSVDDPVEILSEDPGVLPNRIRLSFHAPSIPYQPTGGQVLDILVNVYYSSALGAPPDLMPYATAHISMPAANQVQFFTFDLPLGYSFANSTALFSLVAYQELTLNNVMVRKGPALTGMINPQHNLSISDFTHDTQDVLNVAGTEHEETPGSGSWDGGPTVPPTPPGGQPR
jgi:hypothetical protein